MARPKPTTPRRTVPGVRRLPSGRYQARWREWDGAKWQEGTATFATQQEALDHRASVRTAIRAGSHVRRANGRSTLAEWSEEWLTARRDDGAKRSTLQSAETAMRLYVLPVVGATPVGDLTPAHVRKVLSGMSDLAPNTKRNYGGHFRACLAAAVEDGLISASPWLPARGKSTSAKRVRLPKAVKRDYHLFDSDEVDAMAAVMPERLAALLPLGIGSGLRLGEMLGLTVGEVDGLPGKGHLAAVGGEVGPGVIRVRRQMTPGEKGGPTMTDDLKTDNSRRDVAVPRFVVATLAEQLDRFGVGPGGLIFHARTGAGMRGSDAGKAWRAARKVVGIRAKGFHDLRHTYITHLIRDGISLPTVAKMSGDTIETLLRFYAHELPGDDVKAADLIEDLFGA